MRFEKDLRWVGCVGAWRGRDSGVIQVLVRPTGLFIVISVFVVVHPDKLVGMEGVWS